MIHQDIHLMEEHRTICFVSPHNAYLSMGLSRHGRAWFITWARAYGMLDNNKARVFCRLNNPSSPRDRQQKPNCFWFNTDSMLFTNAYKMILESEPTIARKTGRKRMERMNGDPWYAQEIECEEIEVLMPEWGLLRQCFYCFDLETEDQGTPDPGLRRFQKCEGWLDRDCYWCQICQEKGWFSSYTMKLQQILSGEVIWWNIYSENVLVFRAMRRFGFLLRKFGLFST
ncbi:hypothetical protein D9758_001560 [Tetrapyrgos nigripes]|uniref:Uncharacterized protein n=1 Tax=Tetrapyrgos nigripes TaxID=182062 RepID=A0A8H5GXW1_9AGAR|nr:hypothetical protein D9758_001560 [Tetrapyrgos nigripes]